MPRMYNTSIGQRVVALAKPKRRYALSAGNLFKMIRAAVYQYALRHSVPFAAPNEAASH